LPPTKHCCFESFANDSRIDLLAEGMQPHLSSLPPRLLRFYRREDSAFARSFATDGRLRLWELRHYQRVGDSSRKDVDEGEGRLRVPCDVPVVNLSLTDGRFSDGGTVSSHFNFGTTWVQPLYVFCTCRPEVDLAMAQERFGPEVVEIHEPALFAEALISVRSDQATTSVSARCRRCGQTLPAAAKFCPNCGKEVGGPGQANPD
jgi:hypothetical protein